VQKKELKKKTKLEEQTTIERNAVKVCTVQAELWWHEIAIIAYHKVVSTKTIKEDTNCNN